MLFIDTEVNAKTKKIEDIGCINSKREEFHSNNINKLINFIRREDFFVGHNIINHDLIYLNQTPASKYIDSRRCIDTLFLSTLLFPEKPYHSLVKNDKLQTNFVNNPLNDAKTTEKLFADIVETFNDLETILKNIYYLLLKNTAGFEGFFKYLKYKTSTKEVLPLIVDYFKNRYCHYVDLQSIIEENPVELAYVLALINTKNDDSLLPEWVLKNYSKVEDILWKLRNTPCTYSNCFHCKSILSPQKALLKYFGYPAFRDFDGIPLQEQAVKAAINNQSMVVIFPTGGGKSLTFQLPALISMETVKGLTVVISPLISLMKDQVDNLEAKSITSAVFINSVLDPLQRKHAIDKVKDGTASLLYIAPESLRLKTIERLLMSRQIVRFVIDEAHCFSTWGHDFRPDYQFIATFIKNLEDKKALKNSIPVSCFTATAKKQVVDDIKNYFKDKLDIDMQVFQTSGARKNLSYKVYQVEDEFEKYDAIRNIISQEKTATIIYTSRRKRVEELYNRLSYDNYLVSYFHGGLENEVKVIQQNDFMSGKTNIMVATNAFGMGVDKQDVGCVIHYDISDSLENYVQESGRAGRDQNIKANCYILYNENDLNSHFEMLNNTKINKQEIEQVWSAIKNMTRYRDNVSKSTLEIAREAGWDETVYQLETRVVTAIATLEDIGYIRRGHNSPKVFANSILAKSVIEANKTIDNSYLFDNKDKTNAKRIMGSLISNKYQIKIGDSIPEIRVDYLSDILGVPKEDIIRCINLLREAKLLTDDKDLYTQIKYGSKPIQAIKTTKLYANIINHLLVLFSEESKTYNTKAINEDLINKGYEHKLLDVIKAINYLEFTQFIKMKKESKDTLKIHLVNKKDQTIDRFRKITTLGSVIINFIYVKVNEKRENENIVNFSLLEVTKYVNNIQSLFQETYVLNDIQEALLYLTKINALQIEGGFFVIYSPLYIERIEKNNAKQFTNQDYNKLLNHYENKKQQIHIVGEYATKVVDNYKNSLIFVNDYFTLEYKDFLNKYFPGERRKDLEKNMSPKRFKELFGTLSTNQLAVIQDKTHKRIAVAAGPGSGKTRLLVHKLASIISTEDIRSEQLLMLTFSRAAVSEFKERLINLVGKAATYIKITTFLSYAFDILGKQGNIDNTINIIKEATDLINSREVNPVSATKMVLVIDEAQDMNEEEYNLVQALINYNESIRIIAVGDDDQNIFEWRGSNCRYFTKISEEEQAFYELPINYRSKNNLVDFANQLIKKVRNRFKKQPIQSFTNVNGHIKITKYTNNNLVIPVVKDILNARLKGTTCIITRTNEQAILIAGLLNHYGKKAELIQTSVDILLYNIFELRTFFNFIEKYNQEIITDKMWNESIQMFKDTFKNSINFNLSQLILKKFRNIAGDNPYRSDLKEFLLELRISDFNLESPYIVSTFHKAKGKEFDNVFLLYTKQPNLNYINDDEIKTIYVGITRAKTNLSIHTDSDIFDNIQTQNLRTFNSDEENEKPTKLIFQFGYTDVILDYYINRQKYNKRILAGTALEIEGDYLKYRNKKVIKFSQTAQNIIKDYLDKGYQLNEASVNYQVYWYKKETEEEIFILLPKLVFQLIDQEKQLET